jgi:hypothetical protein
LRTKTNIPLSPFIAVPVYHRNETKFKKFHPKNAARPMVCDAGAKNP